MANLVHSALKRDFRVKGLVALYEAIEADLPSLSKALLVAKHTQDDMLIDNFTRGQIVAINRMTSLLDVLMKDNPNE